MDDDDDEEGGTWLEGMEKNIKAANIQEIEQLINGMLSSMSAPNLSNEDYLAMIKEFDHEKALSDRLTMDLVKRISVTDRPAFFRYFMLLMFSRMAEKEGTPEVIRAMERAGVFRMANDDTSKPWRGLFGKVPRFEPNLLGMIQTAMRPRANPTGDRSELERDPHLSQTVREALQGSPGGPGPIQADDVVRCTGAALWVYGHRNQAIQQVLKEDEDAEGLTPDELLHKAMPDMLMLIYFLLLASGVYEKLIEGLVRNNPLLKRVGTSMNFELTPAGRSVEWIKK
jgi:hypothetical protein